MEAEETAALKLMEDWLSGGHALGRKPFQIEKVGEFGLYGRRYRVFKFKESSRSSKWLVGASCGNTGEAEDVYSDMSEYDPQTAVKTGEKMIKSIREGWLSQVEEVLAGMGVSVEDIENAASGPAPEGALTSKMLDILLYFEKSNYINAILYFLTYGLKKGWYSREALNGDLNAALWRAYALINLDDFDLYREAEHILRAVEQKGVRSPVWCYRYSVCLSYMGRYEKAYRYAAMGSQADPSYPWAFLQKARLAYKLGLKQEAMEAALKGLELVPGDYEFLTTIKEIEERRPFEAMIGHYIDPRADIAGNRLKYLGPEDGLKNMALHIRSIVLEPMMGSIAPYMEGVIVGAQPPYSHSDVEKCGEILENYIHMLLDSVGDENRIAFAVAKVVEELNALSGKISGNLVTSDNNPLFFFIEKAAKMAGLSIENTISLISRACSAGGFGKN